MNKIFLVSLDLIDIDFDVRGVSSALESTELVGMLAERYREKLPVDPIEVSAKENGRYSADEGRTRFAAARMAGLKEVLCELLPPMSRGERILHAWDGNRSEKMRCPMKKADHIVAVTQALSEGISRSVCREMLKSFGCANRHVDWVMDTADTNIKGSLRRKYKADLDAGLSASEAASKYGMTEKAFLDFLIPAKHNVPKHKKGNGQVGNDIKKIMSRMAYGAKVTVESYQSGEISEAEARKQQQMMTAAGHRFFQACMKQEKALEAIITNDQKISITMLDNQQDFVPAEVAA